MVPALRAVTGLSISEILSRVASARPLLEITPFRKNWREQRKTLVTLAHGIEDGSLPLTVADGANEIESPVSLEMLKNLIQHFHQIELETQADMLLENGEIDDPSEFVPTEPDWTR
jgi:hypothetical protein